MLKIVLMDKQINIVETLDWYLWAGVDEICADKVCLSENLEKKPAISYNSISKVTVQNTLSRPVHSNSTNLTALKNARDICAKVETLDELKSVMLAFDGCNLKDTAASTVFGDGSATAKIMLIGEAPGADEDRIGLPFVGRCGRLLDKMLAAIGFNRKECYITNVLPWRPPGNRTPTDDEIAVCLPFLKRQIELIHPDIILLLGGIALKAVMDCSDSISRTRGKWLEYSVENKNIQVLATYHPSYLLRSSAQKAKAWTDLLRLKRKIDELK
ncbi:MAG: uracil-DNA glycosylase [Alphaproteobacteria bacterium]|nr:uracil-DNA glycosylase [Alphaproteobacteria bacterium]